MKTRFGFPVSVLLFVWAASLQAQSDLALLGNLPDAVRETSGLLVDGPYLVTHNDSGNDPVLYYLDTVNLEIQREVRVEGAVNKDWEDLAADADFVYIGDFGNTRGNRTDLVIYRIARGDLAAGDVVTAEPIFFSYEDQADFSGTTNSDWDAEAMVVRGDSLFIFTKQWQSNGTVAYRIPTTPGTHSALRVAAFDAGGLVTGATSGPDGGIFLLGYTAVLQPFLVTVPQATGSFEFPAATQRQLLNIGFGQAEGITADGTGRFFISTEAFANALASLPAAVYTFRMDPAEPETPGEPPGEGGGDPEPEPPGRPGGLVIYRPEGSTSLYYEFDNPGPVLARAVYDTAGRRVLFQNAPEIEPGRLEIGSLKTSVYYLTLYFRGTVVSEPFIRY
ncbi:hypothetical protein [Robiginitalea sp. SC105]|uniref:hypothetical protein n=1 Tax=Robiginitalea sp. SC105 TaxID=2762332 RepID=UPI00163B0AB8|nr:hypothetical protein [Robiginitalea sp. SC105]MBC2840385.1 hypothetical protein [Robiginitalea sp. SC105]